MCDIVTRGPRCQHQQYGGGSLCLATGLVKGEGSKVREQSPLKEPPLSTRLYIAGRDGAVPISAHIMESCDEWCTCLSYGEKLMEMERC